MLKPYYIYIYIYFQTHNINNVQNQQVFGAHGINWLKGCASAKHFSKLINTREREREREIQVSHLSVSHCL